MKFCVVARILIYYLCFLTIFIDSCPKICECKWKHGKVWVICSNANFIDVPLGLDPASQVLDLSNNNLKILFQDAFIDRGLINLQKVFLVNCKLKKIDKHSFRRLINLVELNLAYNLLAEVPTYILDDIPGLRQFSLKRNNITVVQENSFQTTPDLVHLDLSFNAISRLQGNPFKYLPKLEVLKLSGNKIVTISDTMFRSLTSLHVLHLHSNMWNCDCKLRPVIKWITNQHFASSTHPKCLLPIHLQGEEWRTLNPELLFCIPIIKAVAPRMLAMNGDNITLSCKIDTESDGEVSWYLGNESLGNGSITEDTQKYSVLESQNINSDQSKTIYSNLTILEAEFRDEGIFRCVVSNEAGIVEANVTLQISEVIKEDPLVANEDSYLLTGAILGGVVTVTFLIIVSVSLLFVRKKTTASHKTNSLVQLSCENDDRLLSLDSSHEHAQKTQPCLCPPTPNELRQNVYASYQINQETCFKEADHHSTSILTNKNLNPNQGNYQINFASTPSVKTKETTQCKISFVEVPTTRFSITNQPNSSVQRNLEETPHEGSYNEEFPDILNKCHELPSFCTLSRSSRNSLHNVMEKSRNPSRNNSEQNLPLQPSRSSSCLQSNEGSHSPFKGHIPPPLRTQDTMDLWSVKPSNSLESIPHGCCKENPSTETVTVLSSGSSNPGFAELFSTPLHGVECSINSIQLQRILQEYNFMKQEIRRLKEAQEQKQQEEEQHS